MEEIRWEISTVCVLWQHPLVHTQLLSRDLHIWLFELHLSGIFLGYSL